MKARDDGLTMGFPGLPSSAENLIEAQGVAICEGRRHTSNYLEELLLGPADLGRQWGGGADLQVITSILNICKLELNDHKPFTCWCLAHFRHTCSQLQHLRRKSGW